MREEEEYVRIHSRVAWSLHDAFPYLSIKK